MKPSIRNKLVAGFASVLVLMAAVAGIGAYAVFSLRDSAYEATRVGARLNSVALEIQVHNLEAERRVRSYMSGSQKDSKKARGSYLEEAGFEINEIRSLASSAIEIAPTDAMRAKFQGIVQAAADYDREVKRAVEVTAARADSEPLRVAMDAYEEVAENLHESAEDGEAAGRDASQASLDLIDRTSGRAVFLVIGISLAGLALGAIVSYKLARAILVPVEHLKDVAENVSLGNLDIAVRRYSNDEIGDLADSFSRMVTAVKFFQSEASCSIESLPAEVSGGDK